MGNNPRDAITLFYRVRGNVDDSVLTEQLTRYQDNLETTDEPEHLIRIANNASVRISGPRLPPRERHPRLVAIQSP